MKSLRVTFVLWLLSLIVLVQAQAEGRLLLFQSNSDSYAIGVTNYWWLPISRLKHLPEWHADEGKPPLSLTKAIQIGRKWVTTKGHQGAAEVISITILPVGPTDGAMYRNVYYYRILFSVPLYGHMMTCIVLMDGTVIDPEPMPNTSLEPTPTRH